MYLLICQEVITISKIVSCAVVLDFAKDCMYITKDEHKRLDNGYDEVNAMVYRLMNN